jgi:hypothetical protein
MTDWTEWHAHYDADTSLSRRLRVVQDRLRELFHASAPPRSVLALCAGEGRDLIPVLADLPAAQRPVATLVELDAHLADNAQRHALDAGVSVNVIVGDAGSPQTWASVPPVDLLMLCGIFGNVSLDDVQATIREVPGLLNDGGHVIWTRGYFDEEADVRPQVRQWFTDAGLNETSFDAEPTGYGVGVNAFSGRTQPVTLPDPLFTFVH